MKKKIIALASVLVLATCFMTACGTDNEPTTQSIDQVYVNTMNNAKDAVEQSNSQTQNVDKQADELLK